MKELTAVHTLFAWTVLAFASVTTVAQIPAPNSETTLPECKEANAGVNVHTAVRLLDSRKYLLGLTPDKFLLGTARGAFAIQCFSEPDEPHTVGFVIDYSSSIHGSTGRFFVEGIREFVRLANEGNTYFGIGFKGKPFLMLAPTNKRSDVEAFIGKAETQERSGSSSVNDAVRLALEMMPSENPGRRILIVASDGQDTASRFSNESAIGKALRRAGVRVFAARIVRDNVITTESSSGVERMMEFAGQSGGGWLAGTPKTGLAKSFGNLSIMLRAEYMLGFTPAQVEEKWHELSYSVKVPKGFERIKTTGAHRFFY